MLGFFYFVKMKTIRLDGIVKFHRKHHRFMNHSSFWIKADVGEERIDAFAKGRSFTYKWGSKAGNVAHNLRHKEPQNDAKCYVLANFTKSWGKFVA